EANETVKGQGSDSSTNSSTSTSPVLSITTLQTTPSPPPVDSSKQSLVDPSKPTVSRNTGPIFSESASSRSIPSSESSSTLASENSSPTSASKPVAPRPITIAVAPVLDPPRLLPSIPHVPVTVKHLPQFSLEAFKSPNGGNLTGGGTGGEFGSSLTVTYVPFNGATVPKIPIPSGVLHAVAIAILGAILGSYGVLRRV
ncbi:hypothetical protein C8J56DRAFT_942858, partial [Mycena floridula]